MDEIAAWLDWGPRELKESRWQQSFECGRLVVQWTEKGMLEEGAVSADVYSVPHMENVHDIQVEMSDRSQEI